MAFELSRETHQEIFEKALPHDGSFMERLIFYMVEISGYIEKGSLKLCQE